MQKYLYFLLAIIIAFISGFAYSRLSYHSGKPSDAIPGTQVTGISQEAHVITNTQIIYVEKPAGDETDLDVKIGQPDFTVRVNGRDQVFTKTSEEAYMFEKNRISLDQSSKVAFELKIIPADNTRHYGLGLGIGFNGLAGIGSFPVQGIFDGWVYLDKAIGAGGLMIRF
jgi:hypothetical protein